MIATTRTTTFEVQAGLLGAVDLWWLAADAVDLELTRLVVVDSPRQGWTGHGLSGAGPVAIAAWTRPDTTVVEVELATDVADDTEHQELVRELENRLGDRLVSVWDLHADPLAQTSPGRRRFRATAARMVDWVSLAVAEMAYWAAAVLAVPRLLPGGIPLIGIGGGVTGALTVAAAGWLVRQLGRPLANLLDPTAHDSLHDWVGYLRYRVVPWLLAVAVVVLGAGWAG